MKIALLHISDIHIQTSLCPILGRVEKICSTINDLLPDVSAVLVIATGDIAYSGSKEEYVLAKAFIDHLLTCIRAKTKNDLVYFFPVAGNHDGEFLSESGARKRLISGIKKEPDAEIDSSTIDIICQPQKNYFAFAKEFESKYVTHSDNLWTQHEIQLGDKSISISAINASWMSQVPEEPGTLVFPTAKYSVISKASPADLRIAIVHHPLNWYSQSTYHPLRELCRTQYQIVMSGHEHLTSASLIKDLDLGENLSLEAGALWPHKNLEESCFSVITLDLSRERFARVNFVWEDNRYVPTQGDAVWDSFVALPKRKNEEFTLTDSFKKRLEDVGATFTHPNKERLVLSDIYIYPELVALDSTGDIPETLSARILLTEIEKLGKILLRGDDQFGKTALLHTLHQKYLNAGFVPVLLSGKDVANSSDEQFQRKIISAVMEQYGDAIAAAYAQLPLESKIILLDDLDRSGLQSQALVRMLGYIDRHFTYAVVTVGERFDLAEATSSKTLEAAASYSNYRFHGFGFKLRSDLIVKWLNIGSVLSDGELQIRVHEAEVIIDAVIGKGLVPTTAFNILVLLQALEISAKGTLANAGMAQYYEFLIRRSLLEARLKTEQLDEMLSYLSSLAWVFIKNKVKSLDESVLSQFNKEFSEKIYETEFGPRMEFLIKCRVLSVMGTSYSFRYPYILYFFAAKYIADNVDDVPELRQLVLHSCNHLYLRENANIILFLTHHAPSKWIIREIANVLTQLISNIAPLDIKQDTKILNGWVTQTAKVIVDTTDIKQNRLNQRDQEDKFRPLPDNEPSSELDSMCELDFVSQINLLFKTSEILGQILKNKYGSLEREFKQTLMQELFNGPLRGINFFLQLINEAPEAVIEEVGKKLMDFSPSISREDADKLAQKLIFLSVGTMADGLVARQGEIIGSPKLKTVIDDVVLKSNNDTFKLVSIAAQLSYPGNPPFANIEAYAKEVKGNVFGFRLLQGIISRHLYMFSLPYYERQRLADAVSVGVKEQNSITIKSAESKKMIDRSRKPTNPKNILGKLQNSFLLRNKELTERVLKGVQKSANSQGEGKVVKTPDSLE